MSMYKAAQDLQFANDDLVISLPIHIENLEPEVDDVVMLHDEMPSEEQVVEMHAPEQEEVCFDLSNLPGCDDDEIVELKHEVTTTPESSEEDKKDKSKSDDQPKDLNWIKSHLDKIPKHKGETLGIERAKSYLNKVLTMLSKMIQDDHDGKIDVAKAEEARIVVEDGIERLDKELQKRKKKANKNSEITKEAAVGGFMVTVPLIVSSIARVCINSTISGGKDIEHTFERLAKKYKLTDREKVEVIQLLADMNYPLRRDMGFMVDDDEKYQYSSENNYNFVPNYQA